MTRAKDPVPAERSVVLTDRENQVLSWAQEGKSNWEIGKILSISERTVKFHMANICDKLEVSNRSHAIAKALRCGLI